MEVNKIYNGDVVDILKTFPDNFFDLVLTSPPYNIGVDYGIYKDNMDFDLYWTWCFQWLSECYRVLKPEGRTAIMHYLSYGSGKYRCSPISILENSMRNIGFKHHAIVLWADNTRAKCTAWGSWLSATSPYINCPYEGILIMYKEIWTRKKGKSTVTKDDFVTVCGGIINIKPCSSKIHPAPFPEKLATMLINVLTFEDDIVLDPFIGSGTTAVAAKKLNRNWIGIEINPEYIELANERINKTTIQDKLLFE